MIEFKYDDADLCESCGTPLPQHGDVCDLHDLDTAAEEARVDRARDMDRDDWEANSD
jgi:hypothetical protein